LFAPIARSFWMALLVFSFVNFILYPAILQYQAGTVAGHYLRDEQPLAGTAYLLQEAPVDYSFEFDCPNPVERIPMDSLAAVVQRGPAMASGGTSAGEPATMTGRPGALVFAPTAFADSLARRGFRATPLHSFPNFHISQLTGKFIDYRTRLSVTNSWSLMRVTR